MTYLDNRYEAAGKIAGLLLFGLVFVGVILCLFWTKVETVTVVDHYWRFEQQVEDYQRRNFDGWDEYVPDDAEDLLCESRRRGETCYGDDDNNTCYANYDDYCTWTALRWQYLTSYYTDGGLADRIIQPEPNVRCNGVYEIGCQRYGMLISTFLVYFEIDNRVFSCNYNRDTWQLLVVGQEYSMVFGTVFNEPRCGLNP